MTTPDQWECGDVYENLPKILGTISQLQCHRREREKDVIFSSTIAIIKNTWFSDSQ